MIRFALQSERLGPLPLVNHFIQRFGWRTRSIGTSHLTNAAQFPMLAPWNTPSAREMVRKIHSKLSLRPAESKIAVVHCRRFLKFRRDMGSLLYTEGQNISCHA